MSSNKKSFTEKAAVLACVLSLCGSVLPSTIPAIAVSAEAEVYISADDKTVAGGYYYDNLTIAGKEYDLGKKFYAVLDDLRRSGDFKDGKISCSLDGIVSSDQLKAWVENGDLTVPKAFGAARDSFLMDHPELFYIDLYKVMINAGYSGGQYTGYIDSGREPNIYRDNAFKSEAEVNEAVTAYNTAVKKFADDARSNVDQISSVYKDDGKLAVAANTEIANNVKYDYAVYNDYMENGENAKSVASLAHTAYGALVNKKAVCSGYSFGYKAVMDALGVPTVVVSGYSTGKDRSGNNTSGNVPHSWNYVKLEVADKSEAANSGVKTSADGQKTAYEWFAFDTTWNGVKSNKNKYSVMDAETASEEHMPEAIVSSSNYPLDYPALSSVPYEEAVDPNVPNREITSGGFNCSVKCTPSGNSYTVMSYCSYNGKNSGDLARTENARIAQRQLYMDNGVKKWTRWQDFTNSALYYEEGHVGLAIQDQSGSTMSVIAPNVQKFQYAVIKDLQPDQDIPPLLTTRPLYYSDNDAVSSHAVFMSEEIENPVYGTYTPPPYIVYSRSKPISGTDVTINSNMSEPGNSSMMADSKALNVKLVYDEPLHLLDESKDAEVAVTARVPSALEYSGLVKFPDGKYVHLSEDENGVLNTVEFKFKPSLMFEHNRVGYHFTLKNVGSAKIVEKKNENGELVRTTSDRTPNSAYYVFSRAIYACPKVFGDGRLYIDCCAQPTLVDNSDLAATGFEDENGNPTFSESARSQMMLVVNDVRPETEKAILDGIDAGDNGIKKTDIQKSQTYDINLQMCGKIAKIPDKSYVRLGLGFPEGYGPDDEGVTFKIFHRKHIEGDRYEIEEIPCVVTKFGIVVTVNSFSPYTVVVVPEDKVSTRTITASIDGKGGTLSKKDGLVRSIAEGESYTYTLTPQEGYQIYKVLLNDKDVTDKVVENSFTVGYGDLGKNNELEIKYISNESKVRYEANKIVDPVKIIVPAGTDLFGNSSIASTEQPGKSSNVGLILGLVFGGVFVAAAAVTVYLIFRKKNTDNNSGRSKQTAAGKPQRNAARTTAQSPARTTTQSTARPSTQSPTRTTTQSPARTTTQSPARPSTQSPARTTAQSTARSTTQSPARPSTQSPARTTAQSTARSTTQSTARPTTQSPARTTAQSPARTTAQSTARSTTQSTARTTAQSTARPTTQSPARTTAQSPARTTTQNAARTTAQSPARPTTAPRQNNDKK